MKVEEWKAMNPHYDERKTQLDRIEAMLIKLTEKKKPKPRGSKAVYPQMFESAWAAYPKRSGSNPKRKAYSAFLQRIKEYENAPIFSGITRYAAFCVETGKTGTEYVMQAATFFGPDKHYENDWTIPAAQNNPPKDDNKLTAWATNHNYRPAHPGETFSEWRRALEQLHREAP